MNAEQALVELSRRNAVPISDFLNEYGERVVVFKKYTGNYFVTGDDFGWDLDIRVAYLALFRRDVQPVAYQNKDRIIFSISEMRNITSAMLSDIARMRESRSEQEV